MQLCCQKKGGYESEHFLKGFSAVSYIVVCVGDQLR